MSLDEDEIDALAQAGAVVLRWAVLALGVAFLARVACGCGGDQFTVAVFPGDGGAELVDGGAIAPELVDARPAQETSRGEVRGAVDPPDSSRTRPDAGAGVQDAGTVDPPDADAGAPPPPPIDAGPPPPPPALCCLTPCSGSTPAAITCGNGAPWTCAVGTCMQGACNIVGAACSWMSGSCAGRVEVCP